MVDPQYIDEGLLKPYWVNTGGTQLIETLALKQGMALSDKSAMLLNGGTIDTIVNPHIVLRNIDQSPEAFWNFLFFAGYLKPVDLQIIEGAYHAKLAIPNKEVRGVYRDLFEQWLSQRDPNYAQTKAFIKALFEGDAVGVQETLESILLMAISVHDKGKASEQPEKLYHGFILGLLVHFRDQYEVQSNPESGYGRADVLIRSKQPGKPGAVMEFKAITRLKDFKGQPSAEVKETLSQFAMETLAPHKKKLGPGALELLVDRVGGNFRLLQSELTKLALYSDAATISKGEVDLLVGHAREDEYFELSDAIQKRNFDAARKYVADVVEGQGAHPLQLLSSVASIVRAMLTNFERINRLSGGKLPRNYNDFQARVFPALEAEAKANKSKVPHPYAAFMSVQSAMGYGRQELLRGLVACAEADLALKLGGDVLVLERLLWTLCGKAAAWDSQMHVIRREQER